MAQEKQGNVIAVFSSYAASLEQRLLHFTFAWIGASVGFLQGSFKATQRLQPHFTSTHGFKDLLYGSEHRQEREHLSVTDLVKSWIPSWSSSKPAPKQIIDAPRSNVGSYSGTNGFAKESATAIQTDPTVTPGKPLTVKAQDLTPKKMYDYVAEPAKGSSHTTHDYAISAPATHPPSYETDPIHGHSEDGDEEDDEDEEHGAEGANSEDPNHHRKRKKAKAALKKAGQKIKKVFEPIIVNSNKEHGGMIGGCTHPATK